MKNIIKALGIIAIVAMVAYFSGSILERNQAPRDVQKRDFIRDELRGILLELKDIKRGDYVLRISRGSEDPRNYTITLGSFIEKNNIQKYDSISKDAGSNVVKFYKRDGEGFVECCTRTIY